MDCGLFQGLKELRERNWEPLLIDPVTIDAVILTHAHLDHCGYLPRLVSAGFRGRVFCTPATRELCSLVLPDAAHIQEEDAREGEAVTGSREAFPGPAALHVGRRRPGANPASASWLRPAGAD